MPIHRDYTIMKSIRYTKEVEVTRYDWLGAYVYMVKKDLGNRLTIGTVVMEKFSQN